MGDLSSSDSEGWLEAIEGDFFEDGERQQQKLKAAITFASKRQQRGWRLTQADLYDGGGKGRVETCRGPIIFEHAPGQQYRAWDCSLVLVDYLQKSPEEIEGKRVLELGCGVGLPGIAAAVLGAEGVVLTDMEEGLPAIERSIVLNPSVAGTVSGAVLGWGDETEAVRMASWLDPEGIVLCSDLLYGDQSTAFALASTLQNICCGSCGDGSNRESSSKEHDIEQGGDRRGRGASLVLSCHERRWAGDGGAFFFSSLRNMGFTCEDMDPGMLDEQYKEDGIVLTRIIPPRPPPLST